MILTRIRKVVFFKTKLLIVTVKSRIFLRYSTIRRYLKKLKLKLKAKQFLIVSKIREISILYRETLVTLVSLLVCYLLVLEPKLFLCISPLLLPFIIMVILEFLKIVLIVFFVTLFGISILYFFILEMLVVYKPLILRILRIFVILWLMMTILSIVPCMCCY